MAVVWNTTEDIAKKEAAKKERREKREEEARKKEEAEQRELERVEALHTKVGALLKKPTNTYYY